MNDEQIPDIEIMINRMIDGELTAREQADLERRLLRNPEAHAMLRACESLDHQCRDAIRDVMEPELRAGGDNPHRHWISAILAGAAAAALVLGVVLWMTLIETPDRPGPIAAGVETPAPTTIPGVKLASDRFDPTPPKHMMTRPVRQVDRIPVGLYDAESGQMRIILVDREQQQHEPQWRDL